MPTATAPSAEQFQQLFPEFCGLADTQIEAWFTQAALRFTAVRFGLQWHMAAYYFTAHQITIFGTPGQHGTGQVATSADGHGGTTSEKVGDVAKSYGAAIDPAKVSPELQEFLRTAYGVALLGIIMSRSATRGMVVRTGSSRVGAVPGIWGTDS